MSGLDPSGLAAAIVCGTFAGFFLGLLPGLGGKTCVILMTPLALLWGGIEGAVFLISLHSVIHTASSIPAISFGVPVTSADLATVQEGFPLAKAGRASEALGASLTASAFGGVLGAVAFLMLIPFSRALTTNFGPPEFLAFAIFGLTLVAALSESGLRRGIVTCLLGVLISMIGIHPTTSEPRFAMGIYDLWEGVPIQVIVAGVFVVPEMLTILNRTALPDAVNQGISRYADVFRGMLTAFRYWALMIRSSFYGIIIGILPGVGSSVACWWSYGYARRHVKSEVPYGEGALPGVIAPEAANNSKEGGALLPTLILGIPGSSVMAIIMVSLISLGTPVGPLLMKTDPGVAYALGSTIIVANLLAVPLFLAAIPFVTRFSWSNARLVAVVAIVIALSAAVLKTPTLTIYALLAIAIIFGVALEWAGWSRAPLLLGFVLGRMLEQSFYQTQQVWGYEAFQRPIFIVLLLAGVWALLRAKQSRPVIESKVADPLVMLLLFAAVFTGTAAYVMFHEVPGRPFILFVTLLGSALSISLLAGRRPIHDVRLPWFLEAPLLFLAAAFAFGTIAAAGMYAGYALRRIGKSWIVAVVAALAVAAATLFAAYETDVLRSREMLGVLAWWLMDF